ncbi:hypothetical protein EPO56_03925 [Patescibacteria group bacterium]|nr:MAG: hypothetical protein EPO56_03925 [Patescibacteria group bacterium]
MQALRDAMANRRPSIANYHWESGLDGDGNNSNSDEYDSDPGASYSMADDSGIDEAHVHRPGRRQVTGKRRLNNNAMDVIDSMPETGGPKATATPRARKAAEKPPPAPPVFLEHHYAELYNHYMEVKMPESESESSSDLDSSSSDSENDAPADKEARDAWGTSDSEHSRSHSSHRHQKRHGEPASPRRGGGEQRGQKRNRQERYTSTPPHRHTSVPYNTNNRAECFMCAWTNPFHDRYKAKHVHKLHGIMDNYAGCDNTELAMQLHLYFMKRVYKPGKGMTIWTARVALEHIEGLHSLSALIFLGESIKKWKKILFGLENQIYRADGTYNTRAVSDAEKAQKMLNTLYQMKLEAMNFNFGKSTEDTKRIGRNFNFMEEFQPERERNKRKKKKQKTKTSSVLVRYNTFNDL